MFKALFSSAALIAAVALQSADAHSMMTLPKPNSQINNSPSGTIDGPNTLTVPPGKSFGYGHEQNTEAFNIAWKEQTKYKTIRDMIYDKFTPDGASTKECGQSAATGPPQELPDHVEYAGGFDSTHWGPCEVWCDDERVFYDENCAVNIPGKPAVVKYDKAKCVGAKRLQSFWLALHVPAWQAYISCATLTGAGTSAGGGAAPSPATTKAPTPATTTAPTPAATKAPTPAATTAPTTSAPKPATPAATPKPAPATTTKPSSKCTPKRFRRD